MLLQRSRFRLAWSGVLEMEEANLAALRTVGSKAERSRQGDVRRARPTRQKKKSQREKEKEGGKKNKS
jgi:hypothetical protein